MDLRVGALLPQLSPMSGVGQAGVGAYARARGISREAFVSQLGAVLTPQDVGKAVELAFEQLRSATPATAPHEREFLVTANGLEHL